MRYALRLRWRTLLRIRNDNAEAKRQKGDRHNIQKVSAKQIAAISHGLRFRDEFAFGERAF
jgi:hypothetical protein